MYVNLDGIDAESDKVQYSTQADNLLTVAKKGCSDVLNAVELRKN